jgi:hypothetical protein
MKKYIINPPKKETTKQDYDFQKFLAILKQYLGKHVDNDFFDAIMSLECKDYRLHHLKSRYYRDHGQMELAINELRLALDAIEHIVPIMSDEYDNPSLLIIDNVPQNIIEETTVYFSAGETFAMAGLFDDSLKCYQKYHIAAKVKSHYYPNLYSFRPYNEYSLSDLINREITLVHPSTFNDPFDTLVMHWKDQLEHRCAEKTHVAPYKKSFDYYRIRSFSEDKGRNKAYKNILMWSHYADNHRGFCIKYSFAESFVNVEDISLFFRPVIYKNSSEKVNVDIDSINSDLAYCTKDHSWKYENEVRLIGYIPSADSFYSSIPMGSFCRIEAIYFGVRASEQNIATIKQILKNENVKYYKMSSTPTDIYNITSHSV